MENISRLVLVDKKPEEVKKEEVINILERNYNNLDRLEDLEGVKIVWGYLCKVSDYHSYSIMDMDKVILFIDENNYVYGYEHSDDFYPENKEDKIVVGLMDENAEIEPIQEVYIK